jgi:hypothetical protein
VALYDFPLTAARFLAACSKPDAFTPGIATDTITLVCSQESDRVASALGDRATLPLLQWDGALEGAAIARAGRRLMAYRGYNKTAGADNEIVAMAKDADDYLSRLRPGTAAPGKSENPLFVDSASNEPRDAIKVISSQTSDGWTRRGACARRCC